MTLLFSPERYRAVANAYFDGLEARLAAGKSIDETRLRRELFPEPHRHARRQQLDDSRPPDRRAKICGASRRSPAPAGPMRSIEELSAPPRWKSTRRRCARQRLLWASTSAKDPTFSPVKYVEELIAPETVNTMPRETIAAYRQAGKPEARLERHLADVQDIRDGLGRLGSIGAGRAPAGAPRGQAKFVEPFDKPAGLAGGTAWQTALKRAGQEKTSRRSRLGHRAQGLVRRSRTRAEVFAVAGSR